MLTNRFAYLETIEQTQPPETFDTHRVRRKPLRNTDALRQSFLNRFAFLAQ